MSVGKKDLVLVGVCTYNRPVMLKKCLDSLAKQSKNDSYEVLFCIADNNSDSQNNIQPIVSEILNGYNFNYVFVEQRGISFARNAIIDTAIKCKADFIAFIDDDEYAEIDWLENLYSKIKLTNTEAVVGKVDYQFPENTAKLIRDEILFSLPEGTTMKFVGTNNIIFNIKLVNMWGLRFNEKLALTGGEDLDFFMKSAAMGGKHIFTNSAVIYETVPKERATIRWLLTRKMRDGFAVSYVMFLNKGFIYFIRKYFIKSIKNIIISPFYVVVGILTHNHKLRLKGLKNLFYAFGCIIFTTNIKVKWYEKVTGY